MKISAKIITILFLFTGKTWAIDTNLKNLDSSEVFKELFSKNPTLRNGPSLLLATQYERGDVVQIILSSPDFSEVNYADPDTGFSSLHAAACVGNLEIVEHLTSHKDIKIDILMPALHTPLHLANENGHRECAKVLKEKGARPEALNLYGQTAG
jgi:ankyrin repeat protein